MVLVDPLGLVLDHQGLLHLGVLGSDAHRALVGVAALGLQAAQGKHEPAGGVGIVGPNGHARGDQAGRDHLPADPDADAVPHTRAHQGVLDENQALAQRGPHMIGQLQGGGAGAAFGTVDHDKIGGDFRFQHGLANCHEFPRMADAQFKSNGLAPGKLPQFGHKLQQADGGRKLLVIGR